MKSSLGTAPAKAGKGTNERTGDPTNKNRTGNSSGTSTRIPKSIADRAPVQLGTQSLSTQCYHEDDSIGRSVDYMNQSE